MSLTRGTRHDEHASFYLVQQRLALPPTITATLVIQRDLRRIDGGEHRFSSDARRVRIEMDYGRRMDFGRKRSSSQTSLDTPTNSNHLRGQSVDASGRVEGLGVSEYSR